MEELSGYLSRPPAEIDYTFSELPKEYEADILKIFEEEPKLITAYWEDKLLNYFKDKQKFYSGTLVICSTNSQLARFCLKVNPNFLWGTAFPTLAITYEIEKYIVWHEMLHLLGADDCYDLSQGDRGPNCDCPNCIMQYEATKANVGDWPFLCDPNIQSVQKQIQQWKK